MGLQRDDVGAVTATIAGSNLAVPNVSAFRLACGVSPADS